MSHDHGTLAKSALDLLAAAPGRSISEVSDDLGVHRGTLRAALDASHIRWKEARRHSLESGFCTVLSSDVNASIKEIGYRLGFRSQSAVSHCVRRSLGVTPEKLRASVLRLASSDSRGLNPSGAPGPSNSRSNGREQLYLGFGGLRVELNSGESCLGPSNFALTCCLRNFSLAGCKRMSALCSTLSERKLSLTFDVVRASGNDHAISCIRARPA